MCSVAPASDNPRGRDPQAHLAGVAVAERVSTVLDGTLSRASVASRMPVRVGHSETADRILLEVEFDQDDRFFAHDPAVVSPGVGPRSDPSGY